MSINPGSVFHSIATPDSGRILAGFWPDSGRILAGFWPDSVVARSCGRLVPYIPGRILAGFWI
jgi:hypothetical protein